MQRLLNKELITAKSILKDPLLTKRAERKLNFNTMEIYPIKTTDQEIIGK